MRAKFIAIVIQDIVQKVSASKGEFAIHRIEKEITQITDPQKQLEYILSEIKNHPYHQQIVDEYFAVDFPPFFNEFLQIFYENASPQEQAEFDKIVGEMGL